MTPPDEWRRRLLTSAVKAGRSPMVLALFIAGALVTVLMITVVSPLVAPDDKTSRAQGVRAPAGAAVSLPPSPTTEPAERPVTATPTVRLISPPTATVTPRPTEGPSPTATPRRTPTPRPTATSTVVPFIVSHLSNPEARVKLRTEPSPDSDPPILILEPRTPLQFLGDTKTDYEGILWILVRTAEGAVGWVREISTIPAA